MDKIPLVPEGTIKDGKKYMRITKKEIILGKNFTAINLYSGDKLLKHELLSAENSEVGEFGWFEIN